MDRRNYYLTTPIFYPNANLHLGHAYTMTLADFLSRAHALMGDKTYFLAGSDENAQTMVDAAARAGQEPLVFLDEVVQNFMKLYAALDISYDQFIRTTDQKVHWPGAQELWRRIDAAGDLYKKEYEGLYCVGHEAFITEKELVDGKCPDHGTVPARLKEENYFFKLSRYENELKRRIENDELRIVPHTRKNEVLSFIGQGLQDISFSRPRNRGWPQGLGIPVPGDDSQVEYVWSDALANYITALGFGTENDALFREFWPANVHILGKDIVRFHAVIWPAMLLSAGLPLPQSLFVHGFINYGGRKMSKTRGNIIAPEELIEQYGADAVRYYLLRHIPPFEDGEISREMFADAYTAHLANGLGNLVARVMKLAEEHLQHPVELAEEDGALAPEFSRALDEFRLNEAMDFIFAKVAAADEFMTARAPYKGIKSGDAVVREEARAQIERLVRSLASIAAHLVPALPRTAAAIASAVHANKKPANLFPRLG